MAPAEFRTRRMVLRKHPAEDEVDRFATENRWPRIADIPYDPDVPTLREVVWEAGPATELHYVEDDMSPNSYVYVRSELANLASSIGAWTEEELRPWDLRDLLRQVDVAKEPVRLGLAVLRLGLGAPYEYEEETFARMRRALTHEDERTRDMAIWATTYSPWPEYRPLLRDIAEHDPVERLRDRARFTLEAYDAGGIGEP